MIDLLGLKWFSSLSKISMWFVWFATAKLFQNSFLCDLRENLLSMENERYLQPLDVISFFLENGGKATNFDLVNNFKPMLSKTLIGQENHAYLKRKAIQ